MINEFYCDICTAPMILQETIKSSKKYKIRRYSCSICDFKNTIFGSGELDNTIIPERGIIEVNKIFKQEEINRE